MDVNHSYTASSTLREQNWVQTKMGASNTATTGKEICMQAKVYLHIQWKPVNVCQTADLSPQRVALGGHPGIGVPRAVPWKSSDLPPLLHAEAPGPVAPPERGKAFVGNAGGACDKLPAQTRQDCTHGLGTPTAAQTLLEKRLQSKETDQAQAINATLHGG